MPAPSEKFATRFYAASRNRGALNISFCGTRSARRKRTQYFGVYALASPNHYGQFDHNGVFTEKQMITEVNAVTFRQNLGEMLNQVQYRRDSIYS